HDGGGRSNRNQHASKPPPHLIPPGEHLKRTVIAFGVERGPHHFFSVMTSHAASVGAACCGATASTVSDMSARRSWSVWMCNLYTPTRFLRVKSEACPATLALCQSVAVADIRATSRGTRTSTAWAWIGCTRSQN